MRVLVFVSLISMAALCQSPGSKKNSFWNSERVMSDLHMIAAEPHPMGSARNAVIADYLDQQMKTANLKTNVLKFDVEVPDPDLMDQDTSMLQKTTLSLSLQNVTAKYESPSAESCVFLLGSHYDSKRLPGAISLGANDSGSSSATLLEIMRGLQLSKHPYRCHVMAVWFDGEEAWLSEWRDGETRHPSRQIDNTYGSRNFVSMLRPCEGSKWCLPETLGGERVEGLILLDMVGSENLKLSPEANSSPELMALARELDKKLFAGKLFADVRPKYIEDDHIPFLQKGIPAVDLIGFENVEHWHQPSDTAEKISVKSMEQAAVLSEAMLQAILLD